MIQSIILITNINISIDVLKGRNTINEDLTKLVQTRKTLLKIGIRFPMEDSIYYMQLINSKIIQLLISKPNRSHIHPSASKLFKETE